MEEFVPGKVYENLIKMLSYRGAEVVPPILDSSALAQRLSQHEYVFVKGIRKGDGKNPQKGRGPASILIVMLAPNSKYTKSGDLERLFGEIQRLPDAPGSEHAAQAREFNVILISAEPLAMHTRKKLAEIKEGLPEMYIENYTYNIFLFELPKHVLVPQHILADDKEIDEFCHLHYTSKENFPQILQGDPQAVWIGLRPGMVVKIIRPSETAGEAVSYRYCVRGDPNDVIASKKLKK